jgi:hypothetical protein
MRAVENAARASGTAVDNSARDHRGAAAPRAYLFSLSAGQRPLTMASIYKRDLDARMLRTLKAMARRRDVVITLPNWTNHDLRRVVRSGLSALRIPREVAEAVLAHQPPGIVGTYDVHASQPRLMPRMSDWFSLM